MRNGPLTDAGFPLTASLSQKSAHGLLIRAVEPIFEVATAAEFTFARNLAVLMLSRFVFAGYAGLSVFLAVFAPAILLRLCVIQASRYSIFAPLLPRNNSLRIP